MTFQEYLDAITVQVGKHGKNACVPYDDPKMMQIGISTPDGVFTTGVNMVKAHFATGEWREDTTLQAAYEACGGKTPFKAMTRLPPMHLMVVLLEDAIGKAIAEGELVYRAQHDPNRGLA